MKAVLTFFFSFLFTSANICRGENQISTGAAATDLYFPQCKGKNVAVVANHTSLIGDTHLIDTLIASGIHVVRVFAPEHGFRGTKSNGEKVNDTTDQKTGIPIVSLYGTHSAPTKDDLKNIDLIIFDIQDVGVRFYTYISTLQKVMESCALYHKPFLVLDRPNPNGFYVDGPVLEKKYSSFVGMQAVPVVYGMTIGEYALLLNGEGLLKDHKKCSLKVIPLKNYFHSSLYNLPVAPSPNLPDMDAVYLYPSVCLFEGTKVTPGRGTSKPFRLIGFPSDSLTGVSFIPENIPGVALNPPYRDTLCKGLDLSGEGKKITENPSLKLKWLLSMYAIYPSKENFFTPFFEKLAGTASLRSQIIQNHSEEEIRSTWKPALEKFKKIRKKYLLYPD